MRYLILLLILIPAGEIGLLLLSGKTIGIVQTISLIILTGIIGAYLAKKQGMETIKKAQEQLRLGNLPQEELLDGICVLVGGVLLLTPGFITDLFGLTLLIPSTRIIWKNLLSYQIKKRLDNGKTIIIR